MNGTQTLIAAMACGAIAAGCGDDGGGAASNDKPKPVNIRASSLPSKHA